MPIEAEKNHPISVRLPLPLRRTLDAYLQETDRVRGRFVRAAIVEKLRRERAQARITRASPLPE